VISKWVVKDAYEKVKANQGAAGVDGSRSPSLKRPAKPTSTSSGIGCPRDVLPAAGACGGDTEEGRRCKDARGAHRGRRVARRWSACTWSRTWSRSSTPTPTATDWSLGARCGGAVPQALLEVRLVIDLDLRAFLEGSTHCPFHLLLLIEKAGLGSFHLDSQPFLRPDRTWTASSSPRFTRCNTVWRLTPSASVASSMASQPGGASSTKRERRSSVTRMRPVRRESAAHQR